jgi:hypothetical protein
MRAATVSGLRELLRTGALPVRVVGACMAPAIESGALLQLRPARRLWPGDVVALATPDGRVLAHRVLGCARGRVFTQADASRAPDGVASRERLLGRLGVGVGPADRLRAAARLLALVLGRIRSRLR